jgi:6-phosphogluconolactonase (cycloisomerase 2 family)
MNVWSRAAILVCILGATLAGPAIGTAVAAKDPAVIGHLYVNDNTTGVNTVAAFDRLSNGSLTAIDGSPFKAGGLGTGGGIGSQGSLQLSADDRYVLAADAASNEISVLRVRPDGALRPLEGGPIPSGGSRPVSIAVHGALVYVANQGDVPNVTGYRLNPGGHLRAIPDSTFELPSGSNPGDVLFSPNGKVLAVALVGHGSGPSPIDGAIATFTVGGGGTLSPAPGSPLAAQENGPFGSAFSPQGSHIFVTNAHAGLGQGSVSSFAVGADGSLVAPGPPVVNGQTGTCWAAISPDGAALFAVNTGTSVISAYSVGLNGSLALASTTALANPAALPNLGAVDAQVDPTGSFLYVTESRQNAVAALVVSGRSLSELAGSPFALPAGATAAGIAVD